jgi:hypothetical protein
LNGQIQMMAYAADHQQEISEWWGSADVGAFCACASSRLRWALASLLRH